MKEGGRSARPSVPPKPQWLRSDVARRSTGRDGGDSHHDVRTSPSFKRKASDDSSGYLTHAKLTHIFRKRKSSKQTPISPLARESVILKPEVDSASHSGESETGSDVSSACRRRNFYYLHIESCPSICASLPAPNSVTSSMGEGMKRATSWQTSYRDLLGSSSSPTISESPEDDDDDSDVDTGRRCRGDVNRHSAEGTRAISLPRDFFLSTPQEVEAMECVVIVTRDNLDLSSASSESSTSPNESANLTPSFTSTCSASASPLATLPVKRSSRHVRLRHHEAVSLDDASRLTCGVSGCSTVAGETPSNDLCTCRVQRSVSTDSGLGRGRGRRRLNTVSVGNISSVYNLRVSQST